MNKERLQSLARDLRKTPPRSPRETLGGFVIAEVKFFFDVYDVEEGVL